VTRIAYVVSAYKHPRQLGRLLRRLSTPNATFAVHVDRKTSKSIFLEMQREAEAVPDVHFLERHVSHWRGFGHVRATLKGIADALERHPDFDYVVLLTGQDYPLRPPRHLEDVLGRAQGRSFLTWRALPWSGWQPRGGMHRIEDWHLVTYRKVHGSLPLRRHIPGGLAPYGGGAYWCLARRAVEYTHDFVQRKPEYVRFFRHVLVPDELFFQTILLNSPLRDTIVNDHLRFIDWSEDPGPTILRMEHLPALIGSGKLFARKFDATVDGRILDELDARIEEEEEEGDAR
jgi:Core-2/I-Branching enzyme